MAYLIEDIESSLIKDIEYNPDTRELRITFRRYYVDELVHVDVPFNYFEELASPTGKSHGRFYLEMIKKKFKLKHTYMAEKRKTVNKHSNEKRFIKLRVNVLKVNKEWLYQGQDGVYLDITLALLPDGEVDRYGNLGMLTQDVPAEVYKTDKNARGEILGNGVEFERKAAESQPGAPVGKAGVKDDVMDDLPF
jgi:hypothetical protein